MKINWNYIKAFFLLGVVFFLFAFSAKRNSKRVLEAVSVNFIDSENYYLTQEAVDKLLIQNEVQVQSVGKEALDLSRVEALLEAHDMIESAEVYMSIDGKLGASITQRKPLGRVIDGQAYYIDRQGLKMPLSQHFSARVPLITGVRENQLSEIYPLMRVINNDEFLTRYITGLHRLPNGKYQIYLRQLDFVLMFGEIKNIELKMKNFKAFYQKALKDKKLDAYQKVDLQFGDQVVGTKK